MKKNRLFLPLFVILIISAGFVSCKKDEAGTKPECKITALISGANATAFIYNSEGKVSAKIAANTDRFTYNSNTIVITNTTGTAINTITTIILNGNGLASSVSVRDSTGTNLTNTIYEYNGTELSRSTITNFPGGDSFITNYTWSDGNMISSQSGAIITTYNYAPAKPARAGDLWNLQNLQQGYENIRTKNVLTSAESGNTATIVNYDFDSQGKVIGLTGINGGAVVITINYQYECN